MKELRPRRRNPRSEGTPKGPDPDRRTYRSELLRIVRIGGGSRSGM